MATITSSPPSPMPRFLIVDDLSGMRRIIRGMLQEMGFTEADEAKDGETAFKKLKTGKFDFVISDTELPDMDGSQLVSKVRHAHDRRVKDTPVLLVGSDASARDVVLAAQQGADGFVVKPFTKATLEEKLELIKQRFHCWPCQPRKQAGV